jgi:hypothetical protein
VFRNAPRPRRSCVTPQSWMLCLCSARRLVLVCSMDHRTGTVRPAFAADQARRRVAFFPRRSTAEFPWPRPKGFACIERARAQVPKTPDWSLLLFVSFPRGISGSQRIPVLYCSIMHVAARWDRAPDQLSIKGALFSQCPHM